MYVEIKFYNNDDEDFYHLIGTDLNSDPEHYSANLRDFPSDKELMERLVKNKGTYTFLYLDDDGNIITRVKVTETKD